MSPDTQNTPNQPQPLLKPPRNFEYAIMNAVENDQNTTQKQEITDAQTTINDTTMEEAYYQAWDNILQTDAGNIKTANGNTSTTPGLQATYSTDSTDAQSQQSMCDSATQASQTAVGQDGTNLSNMAQIASAATSIASNMAQVISSS